MVENLFYDGRGNRSRFVYSITQKSRSVFENAPRVEAPLFGPGSKPFAKKVGRWPQQLFHGFGRRTRGSPKNCDFRHMIHMTIVPAPSLKSIISINHAVHGNRHASQKRKRY